MHLVASLIEAADEILIARNDDHHHEARNQRRVDEPEDFQDRVGIIQRGNFRCKIEQLAHEGYSIDRQRNGEAEIEDNQQPA